MSRISTSRSGSRRTTTEESSSLGPNPNVRKGFPVECSCGGQLNLASVRDHTSDGRLCYVCIHIGEGGDHPQKMFDEAVRDEIRWTQTHLAGHEDRLSRVEKNTDPENKIDVSREVTKIYAMIKALREDMELLDILYWSVYEKFTAIQIMSKNGKRNGESWFSKSGGIPLAVSVGLGVLVGFIGEQHIIKMLTG